MSRPKTANAADVTGPDTPKSGPVEFNMADIDPSIIDKPRDWHVWNMLYDGTDMLIMGPANQPRQLTRNVFKTIVAIYNNLTVFGRKTRSGGVMGYTYLSTRGDAGKMEDMWDLVHASDDMGAKLPFIDIRYLSGDERTGDGVCSIIREISERLRGTSTIEVVVIDNLDWMRVPPCEIKNFILNARVAAQNDVALIFVCTTEYDDIIGYQSMAGLYPSNLCNAVVKVNGDSYKVIQDFLIM